MGSPPSGLTVDEVIQQVRGQAGTTVTIGIRHRDGTTDEYPIVRAEIEVPQVSWAFVPGHQDRRHPAGPVLAGRRGWRPHGALTEAIDQGATGVALDLRGNPGGLVDEAVSIASLFLPEGTVYQEEDRSGSRQPVT